MKILIFKMSSIGGFNFSNLLAAGFGEQLPLSSLASAITSLFFLEVPTRAALALAGVGLEVHGAMPLLPHRHDG